MIQVWGCCQEKELPNIYVYNLVEHPIVVHIDVNCLILLPVDVIYYPMIDGIRTVYPTCPQQEACPSRSDGLTRTSRATTISLFILAAQRGCREDSWL